MSITTIIGPMFSGKTTELIRLIDRQRVANKKCLIIKHSGDTRFDKNNDPDFDLYHITTHNEIKYTKCDIVYLSSLENNEIVDKIKKKYDVVGVDEGFFFKGINDFCNELADHGITIYVSSLDTSYKQVIFPEIAKLIGSSEKIKKLKAICMSCQSENGVFTIRTIDSDVEIIVGGTEMYQSVCRKCLHNKN